MGKLTPGEREYLNRVARRFVEVTRKTMVTAEDLLRVWEGFLKAGLNDSKLAKDYKES